MLSNKNILIVGGDSRYIEIINQLSSKKAKIIIVGFDQLTFSSSNIYNIRFNEVVFKDIDILLLPVAGTNKTGKVNITFSDEKDIYINEEIIRQLPNHCVIYTGTTNAFLTALTKAYRKRLICLFDRDDLAVLNSIPTAEGALQIAMEEMDQTIHKSKTMVLGFGRIGITVARLFSAVGAHVYVCARNPAALARSVEMRLTPVKMDQLEQSIKTMDICINTIPHMIINKQTLSVMDLKTLIIDLASDPGGVDFTAAKEKGITALHALGLPGKVAPKTAGSVLAKTLIQLIE